MKTGGKIALVLGLVTGAAVTFMAFNKTGKKNSNLVAKKKPEVKDEVKIEETADAEVNYI